MTRRRGRHDGQSGASLHTVLTAVGANVLVAVAKGVAALVTGSAALWAETLHSIADTGNELLLFVGLRRSKKKEDLEHPFGYGQERYFWAFLAALGIFLIGGVLSIIEGVRSLLRPEPLSSPWVGIAVLVAAACFEGYSWGVARRQLRVRARELHRTLAEHLIRASDPTATTVYLEDSAALVGIALALAALVLHLLTGWAGWDGLASICIGLLLIAVAALLARRSKALLIDESAPQDVVRPIRDAIVRPDWVADVRALDVIFVGPAELLVIARVVPVPDAVEVPARDLVKRVDGLRQELLRAPAITEAAVTVEDVPR
ncbi:cation diffusion facilitator family transporter [Planosporangium thailandense]|uniref:Cation diffusion facilitator family transporter n=1 Tax=Planosporangium thailandense TaxID=765197 RepID=A0ABX0Y1Q1_9ACTN|nr:cation diffusion facilitator family transporter [Planosporangium thailandense]NJC71360.1 cation diffusion facilitator family transporter [Planosporangium thailandense]